MNALSAFVGVLPPVLRARATGKPWWELEYLDGRVVGEWEQDWALVSKDGTKALRLYCPDGRVAVLGNDSGASGRLFQFKVGEVRLDTGRSTPLVVIGMVTGLAVSPPRDLVRLTCQCWAWDAIENELVQFFDTLPDMSFGGPVTRTMDLGVLGIDPLKV